MREATGDLWTWPADIRVVPTNGTYRRDGRAVMGAGVAKQCVERYPGIDRELGTMLRVHGSKTRIIYKYADEWEFIVAFPTKEYFKNNSDLLLIEHSAHQLVKLVDEWEKDYCCKPAGVVMPRVGCGCGQLDWQSQVKPRLSTILDDR